MLHTLDDMHYADITEEGADFDVEQCYDNITEDTFNIPGVKGRNRYHVMECTEQTMRNCGWLDTCQDGLPDVGSLEPIVPSINQSKNQWKMAILDQKKKELNDRNKHLPNTTIYKKHLYNFKPNKVKVVNGEYLYRTFKHTDHKNERIINTNIKSFNLNKEQERAFRIVANHATMKSPEPLRMYLGGMGGTGKSQVIKALIQFFKSRNECHRFIVVAPTGAAAALLNGSTYHSIFCINKSTLSEASLARLRSNLDGVDYVFLDEVSMVSCRDLYKISSQCAKARGEYQEPFGGINFIFAGDFAQLPPVNRGAALYSGTVGTQINSSQSINGQEATIGKALWHQITTVVILRENMRQKTQTLEDSKLRTALENMRYKACTPADIAFLRTKIAGKGPNDPQLAQKKFRNVSIITALNAQKDKINELGCERFAADNNLELIEFYSVDRWSQPKEHKKYDKYHLKDRQKILKDPLLHNKILSSALQKTLWEQPPASTDQHIPGKLRLCIGMPVMLRANDATECCITKGAEATVVNWQSYIGPENQNTLDTLFVKLKDPPKSVKIEGLPENVVPITSHTTSIECILPNDEIITIS